MSGAICGGGSPWRRIMLRWHAPDGRLRRTAGKRPRIQTRGIARDEMGGWGSRVICGCCGRSAVDHTTGPKAGKRQAEKYKALVAQVWSEPR